MATSIADLTRLLVDSDPVRSPDDAQQALPTGPLPIPIQNSDPNNPNSILSGNQGLGPAIISVTTPTAIRRQSLEDMTGVAQKNLAALNNLFATPDTGFTPNTGLPDLQAMFPNGAKPHVEGPSLGLTTKGNEIEEAAQTAVASQALKQVLASHAEDIAKQPIHIDPITGESKLWSYVTAANKSVDKPAVTNDYQKYQEAQQAEIDNYREAANQAIREVNIREQHPDEYLKELFGQGNPYAYTKAEPSLGRLPSLVSHDSELEGLGALHQLKKHLEF